MKKIDEFDSRLFKNVYQKNIDSRQHNKEIKISYIEKIEQENEPKTVVNKNETPV